MNKVIRQVRGIRSYDPPQENWIGVDLNTTGHIAVIAHPSTGRIMKLGKNAHQVHAKYEKLRDNFERHKKTRKLRKIEHREDLILEDLVARVSRQIVCCAQFLHAGIKMERIYGPSPESVPAGEIPDEYSITGRVFRKLQVLIERRARKAGVPVVYVDPSFTSQRCSRCGEIGQRRRKKFECPRCGYGEHADVNAAFNIADAPFFETDKDREQRNRWHDAGRVLRQQLKERRDARSAAAEVPVYSRDAAPPRNILCTLEIGGRGEA